LEARFVYLYAEPSLRKKAPEILVDLEAGTHLNALDIFLCIEPTNVGFMFFDKCVPDAVNSWMPFVVSHPHLKISGCVADIINRLGYV
jgi:MinD-like ATPase involved in chromosome partitioning or flagellar assembly